MGMATSPRGTAASDPNPSGHSPDPARARRGRIGAARRPRLTSKTARRAMSHRRSRPASACAARARHRLLVGGCGGGAPARGHTHPRRARPYPRPPTPAPPVPPTAPTGPRPALRHAPGGPVLQMSARQSLAPVSTARRTPLPGPAHHGRRLRRPPASGRLTAQTPTGATPRDRGRRLCDPRFDRGSSAARRPPGQRSLPDLGLLHPSAGPARTWCPLGPLRRARPQRSTHWCRCPRGHAAPAVRRPGAACGSARTRTGSTSPARGRTPSGSTRSIRDGRRLPRAPPTRPRLATAARR